MEKSGRVFSCSSCGTWNIVHIISRVVMPCGLCISLVAGAGGMRTKGLLHVFPLSYGGGLLSWMEFSYWERSNRIGLVSPVLGEFKDASGITNITFYRPHTKTVANINKKRIRVVY